MDLLAALLKTLGAMYLPLKRNSPIPSALQKCIAEGYPKVSLDAAGLVALADLSTIARRSALTGTSFLLDALVICPGLHRQQSAPELNGGEYPACAAMTTGYVFRVENPATVLFLQKVGETGKLTTLSVKDRRDDSCSLLWQTLMAFYDPDGATLASSLAYFTTLGVSFIAGLIMLMLHDWWAMAVVGILALARLVNVVVLRRRAVTGWKGASEPGVRGDLLILLSQDRWIRMKGAVDDLKAVTSGQWLREPSFIESSLVAFATLLVYLDAALAGNATQEGKLVLIMLLCCSVGLLGVANECTRELKMHGRLIEVDGTSQRYGRRLDLAGQLMKETKRDDWAVRLGMIVPKKSPSECSKDETQVTM